MSTIRSSTAASTCRRARGLATLRATEAERSAAGGREAVAIVPLAVPLLAGPGAISTVIIIAMQRSSAPWYPVAVLACMVLVCAVLRAVLLFSTLIGKKPGPIGLNIINRIFGLIPAAIAVEVIANGIKQLFPVLATG